MTCSQLRMGEFRMKSACEINLLCRPEKFIPAVYISLWFAVAKYVVLMCDGVGRTGIFLVTKSEMERLKLENRVDVFSTVRQLRGSNQHFIPTQDDYDLCHLLLKVDSPESTYGNI
ncbi:putative receptor-type tyrosine-protein phosphatase mosPTP-1 isoform X4 [Apostichopus japonicus]|uniref:putative receptor-type tyrosine-protein phosphatase mosPTP-1 isoform X4 n=1 Tax=Stichopus japonicus TaxID=307972 RepID=UPI003AB773ED